MKINKFLICLLSLTIVVTFSVPMVFASSETEKKQQLEQVQEKASTTSDNLEELNNKIIKMNKDTEDLHKQIIEQGNKLENTRQELAAMEEECQKQQDDLNARLRAMYKNGNAGYIEILLNSNTISDFILNAEMIKRIYKQDKEAMALLQKQYDELKIKKNELEKQEADLKIKKQTLEQQIVELKEDKEKMQAKLDELNQQAESLKDEIASLQAQYHTVYSSGKFIWPCSATLITSPFGYRIHPVTGIYTGHTGVDIGCSMGSNIWAAKSGTVIVAGWYGGYGNAVVIDHGNGISTLYGHNSSLHVSVGQHVKKGQIIASSGSTGVSTGPHLHFEIRENGSCVDPMQYF